MKAMFIDLARKRRSIRRFQDRPVEKEKIDTIIEAALRSPSSRGFNPWELVVVTDRAKIAKLAESKPHGASFVKNAPLVIVVCGEPGRTDVWVEDASIASIFVHLISTDLGLGSCWVQMRLRSYNDEKSCSTYVSELLGLREGLEVESLVAIGYPAEEKAPRPKESLDYDKVAFHNE
jgi:nitroreductase